MVKTSTLLLTLTLLSSTLLRAQYHHFDEITEKHGLSDNRVTCFKKDRQGFLWIGTENGLNRYDGYTFRIYRPGQPADTISHERINDIEQDASGKLWIATWNGLNILDPVTGSLSVLAPAKTFDLPSPDKISSALIWDTYIDANGLVWIAPDNRDLSHYNPKTKLFTTFPWISFFKQALPELANNYATIQRIVAGADDQLWLGTTVGLFSFSISKGTFKYHGGDKAEDCTALSYDADQKQIIIAQQNVYALHPPDAVVKKITLTEDRGDLAHTKNPQVIPAPSGLWVVDANAGTGKRISRGEKNSFMFHHQFVNAVYDDRHGSLWIGTTDGIEKFDRQLNLFHFTNVLPDTTEAVDGNIYHVLDVPGDDSYYISSLRYSRLVIRNKSSGRQREVLSIDGKPLLRCAKVCEDAHHRLWVLTARAIFVSDERHQHFTWFPYAPDENYSFLDMVEDNDGNYWFASLTQGLYRFNPTDKSFVLLRQRPDGIAAARTTSLLFDSVRHDVWIADFGYGVFRYNTDKKKYNYIGMRTADPLRLESTLANSLAQDHDGNIWIATTSGGVSRYRQKEIDVTSFDMQDGLPENSINHLQVDRHGNIWLASHKGLTCMSPSGKIIQHYDQNNGLPYTGFTTPLSMTADGDLVTGIANGYLRFNPDSLHTTVADFPVVITSMQQEARALPLLNKIVLDYDQNEFTVNFSALTYTLPSKVSYMYRLEGFDDDWVMAGNAHAARYTNVEEGTYTFRVKAMDYNGKVSDNTASLAIVINPPFWKQQWFVAVLVLAAISAVHWWTRTLQRRIRSQKILNQVATSLYNQSTLEDVAWTVAKNCIELLHFEDCVVYQLQPDRGVLIQRAAAGPKSQEPYRVLNPIEIPLGQGIVGYAAQQGKAEIVRDTRNDKRYIVDDQSRLSEIAVPIIVEGKVFGVIDSEHRKKNFYTSWHLTMLSEIALICSSKIGRYFAEEQIRSKVARDLHDDMGSTLSSIKIMSNIALEKNEAAIALHYLKSIRQNATAMQESMSDMVWAINPENDNVEQVIIRMKEFCAEILEPLDIQYAFYEDGDFSRIKLDLNTRKDFYLIFKEALNNAAKYSGCTAVMIHLRNDPKGIRLSIEDNGKGFDLAASHNGNGLRNMRHRAASIHAKLCMESIVGKGTLVKVEIGSHDQGI